MKNPINKNRLVLILLVQAVSILGTGMFAQTNPNNEFVTGAISGINGKTIETNSVNKIEQSLNGTLPGLYSINNGGQKFGLSEYNLYVRGKATTGSNAPLILVDGVDANIHLLDPQEIESILVLKDAVELAPYGMRGANGVILVKTRHGQSFNNYIQFKVEYGSERPQSLSSKLNAFQYATLHNEANINDGSMPVFDALKYQNSNDPTGYPSTDLPGDFLRDQAPIVQYGLNAGGGNKVARYFTLLNYSRQDGLFQMPYQGFGLNQTNYQRYNFRTNLEVDLGKGFTLSSNISAVFDDRKSPYVSGYTVNGARDYLLNTIMTTPANAFPLLNPNGTLGGTSDYRNNMIGLLSSGRRTENARKLTANLTVSKDLGNFIKGLKAYAQYSFENYNAYYKTRYTTFGVSKMQADSTYTNYGTTDTKVNTGGGQMSDYYSDQTFNAGLDYQRTFGENQLSAVLNLNNYTSNVMGDVPPFQWMGMSSRIQYVQNARYIFQFSGAYQGSNSFISGKRFGFFPAASMGWILSKEEFLADNENVNLLKFRASAGLNGNDQMGTDRFLYRQIFNVGSGYGFGNPNGTTQGSYEGTLGNPDETWERSFKYNIGIDASLFKNTLTLSLDAFRDNRSSVMVDKSNVTPSLIGITLPKYNAGIIRNQGLEFNTGYSNTVGELSYHLNANLLYAKNTILDVKELPYPEEESYRYHKGNSVGSIYGLVADGIYKTDAEISSAGIISSYGNLQPGDIRYLDLNNDGIINDADKKAIGNSFPELIYGINGGFEFKNFDFSIFMEGSGNFDYYLHQGQFSAYAFENRFNADNALAKYPRLSFTSSHNDQTSTFWLNKAHMFRINALELGYTLPQSISKNKLRVHCKMNNIYSSTESTEGRDFEASAAGYTAYPLMKSILFGLSFKI